MMTMKSSSLSSSIAKVNIATYNVLSSSLAAPSYYTSYNPEVLDEKNRYQTLLAKLESQVASKSVVCLQEVSLLW